MAAQTRSPRPSPEPPAAYGSVTGHVYLSGAEVPARFARVALQPFDVKDPPQSETGRMSATSFTVYQTDLNGAFRIDHVRPGVYYVVVNAPGCVSPFASFSKEELMHPSPEVARRIAGVVPAVQVAANATANLTLRLRRGASMAGTVRFDDGTPFAEAWISVERRDPEGKWSQPRATDASTVSDVDGHWEVAGLPPGDYRVRALLTLQERHQGALLGDNGSTWNNTVTSMPVYLGDTTRERDAEMVKLEDGQQLDGQNITIPVSRMHAVSGALVDAKTGQTLNAGEVQLSYADGDKEMATAKVDPETQTFLFPYVPEGSYKLITKNARLVRYEQTGDPENDPFHTNRKEILLRQYGPGELPVMVQGDMSGANVPVPIQGGRPQ